MNFNSKVDCYKGNAALIIDEPKFLSIEYVNWIVSIYSGSILKSLNDDSEKHFREFIDDCVV